MTITPFLQNTDVPTNDSFFVHGTTVPAYDWIFDGEKTIKNLWKDDTQKMNLNL